MFFWTFYNPPPPFSTGDFIQPVTNINKMKIPYNQLTIQREFTITDEIVYFNKICKRERLFATAVGLILLVMFK